MGDSGSVDDEPDPEGEAGEIGWKVGLWEGAWRGFLGKSETGGECSTSVCTVSVCPEGKALAAGGNHSPS